MSRENEEVTLDTHDIKFTPIDAELFNSVAERSAETLAGKGKDVNKSTQIRRFYDELLLWDSKVNQNPEKFPEYLPFIRMLNAKVAYARGRKHVDRNFSRFIEHSLGQVNDAATLRTFKLFFEAMLGFYKLKRPD
jgi:CRISPR-associated protein Csm2